MSHAFVTVAIPFEQARAESVERYIGEHLGHPAHPRIGKALDDTGIIHFMSLLVVPGDSRVPGSRATLILEATTDGREEEALRVIAAAIGDEIRGALDAARIRVHGALQRFLRGHALTLGQAWWDTLGLPIPGTIGLSVRRIHAERDLARRIAALIEAQPRTGMTALDRLEAVRDTLWDAGDAKWAFAPEPAHCLDAAPDSGLTPLVKPFFGETIGDRPFDILAALRTTTRLAASALVTMLWPALAAVIALGALIGAFAGVGVLAIVVGASLLLAPAAIAWAALVALRALRLREVHDRPVDREPDAAAAADVMRHEGHGVQNLLFAVSPLKPGLFRRLTLRFAMWSVGTVPYFCRPGFLGSNRMIHFARWMLVPGTDKLLFLSNFDGTWSGYVGDFVQNAAGAHGVTSLWSNCEGFPRTRNLIEGANDRDRLVRWARRQLRPVHFWYCAYPDVTTDRFRINAAARQGLASARTHADAADWLALFGSAPRPADAIEASEIAPIAFGGLASLPHASRIAVTFGGSAADARSWLAGLEPDACFGETVEREASLVVALSASGLRELGIPDADLATFPMAFQQGMTASFRARALGDVGDASPEYWEWGGPRNAVVDAIVLVYARSAAGLAAREADVIVRCDTQGHAASAQRLAPLPPKGMPAREGFGFVDGISQPRMRGTRHARRETLVAEDIVGPGELVLGYPDNMGRVPPTPSVSSRLDPAHRLPDIDERDARRQRPQFARTSASGRRDLGRNGTYLVIRDIEQHVDRFEAWLDDATQATAGTSLPADPALRRETLAAKLVGRWRNGTSLVRYPNAPGRERDPQTGVAIDAHADNRFRFGRDDPTGLACPIGAHIRRANPRDGLTPGSREQKTVVDNHRILRVGRAYRRADGRPALMFMCVNADIERQFEFVQQSWLMDRNFAGLDGERDPIPGSGSGGGAGTFTVTTPDGPLLLRRLDEFVRTRGGGYFFVPGRAAYAFLARLDQQ